MKEYLSGKNFQDKTLDDIVNKYYRNRIDKPYILELQGLEEKSFYQFVKACIRYNRRHKKEKNIKANHLRELLEHDLEGLDSNKYIREYINNRVQDFAIILKYTSTIFPNHIVEMKDTILVKWELKATGHTTEEIRDIIVRNSGSDYRLKYNLFLDDD